NATSLIIFEELKNMTNDRKQERVFEKTELFDMFIMKFELFCSAKDVARKKEESYRANFMKIVAKELARMGAPALITWQRLVLDRDCTYQAARILLTKLKSSQKKRPVSTHLPLLESKIQTTTLDERPEWRNEIETNQRLPSPAPKLIPKKPSPVRPTNQVEELAEGMTISRTQTVVKQIKKPDRKLQAALLEIEALKSEINHLEAINATLTKQDDITTQGDANRRMRFLQAQNLQQQRQIDMIMDAVVAHESASNSLQDILTALQQVVQTGLNEAKDAGAEQGKTKWMMAIPLEILQALTKLEKQLAGVTRSQGSSMEQKLRYSKEQLLDENYKEIKLRDIHTGHSCHGPHHIPSLHHLRPNQVVQIENNLSKLSTDLMEFSKTVTQNSIPSISEMTSMQLYNQVASELAKETRSLAAHTASFGALVCSQAVGPGFERNNSSTPSIKAILSEIPPISSAHKDREKHFRMLLERLGCYLSGVEAQLDSCSTELKVLHKSLNNQASAIHSLVSNVQSIGSKKLEWVQETLNTSIDSIIQVYDAFKLHQCQGGINPYGDLLVSTYDSHREQLTSLKYNYKQYSQAAQAKLTSLMNECSVQCLQELQSSINNDPTN
ncbi:hypothetical protein THRCLA_04537, partial [Thraustotheca clavata]